MLSGQRLQHAHVPRRDCAGSSPGLHSAFREREILVGDHQLRIELHLYAQTRAFAAGAVRAVEAEVARLELTKRQPAVHASEMLRVGPLFLGLALGFVFEELHNQDAGAEPQSRLDRVCEA